MPPANLSPLGTAVRRDALLLRELVKKHPSDDHTAEVRRLWDSLEALRHADHKASVELSTRHNDWNISSNVLFESNQLIYGRTCFVAKQRLLVNGLSRQMGTMSQTSSSSEAKQEPSHEEWAGRSARLAEEIQLLDDEVRLLEELKEAVKGHRAKDEKVGMLYRDYAGVWQGWWKEYEALATEFEDVLGRAEMLADEENL